MAIGTLSQKTPAKGSPIKASHRDKVSSLRGCSTVQGDFENGRTVGIRRACDTSGASYTRAVYGAETVPDEPRRSRTLG